jgi:hypothetical protein
VGPSRARATARPPVRIVVVLAGLAIPACAQVTGLSDDYRYDLDAGADASNGEASARDGSGDGPAGDARGQCGPSDRARAATQIDSVNGDDLPASCQTCLAASCCREIDACASGNDCSQAMRCVFQCQRSSGGGSGKAQCLANCRPAFQQTVGSCVAASCSAACQLG